MEQQTAGTIRMVHGPTAQLDPWPIPKDQVVSGAPLAFGRFLWQSEDKRLGNGVWTCTPGSFTWDYTWDETIYLIEGKVTISDQDRDTKMYRAGDLILVPAGTKSTWEISQAIRKVFHLRSDAPVEL